MIEMTGEQATAYARMYTKLADALMKEGVLEPIAREEARMTATTWLMGELMDLGMTDTCPLCGQKVPEDHS